MLRRLSTGDLVGFQAYRHDEELGRYQGWLPTVDEQAFAFLAEMSLAPFPNPGHWVQLGIAEPERQRLIGDIGVYSITDATYAEIGFTLSRSAQGHGVATAAIRAVIELIFECSAAGRVIGVTMRATCLRCAHGARRHANDQDQPGRLPRRGLCGAHLHGDPGSPLLLVYWLIPVACVPAPGLRVNR